MGMARPEELPRRRKTLSMPCSRWRPIRARATAKPRILICGSLYLAGRVLAENG
jgi:hypothetical protein